MYTTERYTLLKTVEYLINQRKMTLFHISNNHDVFFLQTIEKGEQHIVCVAQQTFDWTRQMERDVNHKAQFLISNIPVRGRKATHFHIVYASELTPVDDWSDLVKTRQAKQIKKLFKTVYVLDESNKNNELNRLLKNMGAETTPLFSEMPSTEEQTSITNYLDQQIVSNFKQEQKEFKETFEYGRPKLTIALIIINVIIYFYIESVGSTTDTMDLIRFGAKFNPAIADGEWWRIVSSMFLHIGIFHLMMNMLALFYLGSAVERIFGTGRFLFIYTLAGIFGGIASFATNDAVAAGASGAIFGLFGALLFFGLHNKKLFFRTMGPSLFVIIGINIVFGFSVEQIDNGAHLGGLIGGFIASQIIHLPKKKEAGKQLLALIVFLGITLFLANHGLTQAHTVSNPHTLVVIAESHIAEGEFDEVIDLATEAIEDGNANEYLYFYKGVAHFERAEIDQAEESFLEAVAMNDTFAEAYYNLAVISAHYNEFEEAYEYSSKAIEFQPNEEDFQEFHEMLERFVD